MRIQKRNLFKRPFLFLGMAMVLLMCTSCGKDPIENTLDKPTTGVTPDKPKESDTTQDTSTSKLMEPIDLAFLTQIKKAHDEIKKGEIWKGYDLTNVPQYFVFADKEEVGTRGFVINPQSILMGATKITGVKALEGLNVYRYDGDLANFNAARDGIAYVMRLLLDDNKIYYAQMYSEENAVLENRLDLAIQLAVHEPFHNYQTENWTYGEFNQDIANYPLTKDLLALQILTLHIVAKMPAETNPVKVKEYLKMYVAIRDKEISLDPSKKQLVTTMANVQEELEGGARYIEMSISSKLVPEFNQPFINLAVLDAINNKEIVRTYFAYGVWYETGSALFYMLRNQGIAFEKDVEDEKTPFDVASAHLNLTAAQKAEMLQKAKDGFDWPKIEKMAEKMVGLK